MNINKQTIFIPTPDVGSGSSGGSGSGTTNVDYTRTAGIAVSSGGLAAGYVPTGTVQDLLDKWLYPYQAPAFGSFSFPGNTVLEVGSTLAGGVKAFSWSVVNAVNIAANSMVIKQENVTLASGLANDGAENLSIAAVTKNSIAQANFSIQASNSQNSVFSRAFAINWLPRRFAGVLEAASLSALQAVTTYTDLLAVSGITLSINELVYSKPGSATYNCSGSSGKYIWFLWPQALGTGGFSSGAAPAAFRAAISLNFGNAFGVSLPYYLYISSNPFNGAAVPISVS